MAIPVGFSEVTARLSAIGSSKAMAVVFGVENPSGGWDQIKVNTMSLSCSTFLKGLMSNAYRYEGVLVAEGSDPGTIQYASTTGAGVGGNATTAATPNVAYLFKKLSLLGGRVNRGRMYVPGVTEGSVDAIGTVDSGTLAAGQTAANTFLGALVTQTNPMVLLHSDELLDPTPVTNLVFQQLAATQRRRLR